MFKINANPTFDAVLEIVGQGRSQKLVLTFRHMLASEYADMLQSIADGKLEAADAILRMVEKWDADVELSVASIKLLQEQQPGAEWAIISGYAEALKVERKGN